MTKSEGHNFMTNLFGHWLSDLTRSDPTWLILRGKIMTKLEGHISESAQSSSILYMGRAQQFSLFVFFHSILVSNMGSPYTPRRADGTWRRVPLPSEMGRPRWLRGPRPEQVLFFRFYFLFFFFFSVSILIRKCIYICGIKNKQLM